MTKLTQEEIEAVHAAGPAAVVALVEQLQQSVAQLSQRVNELKERLARNSRNSNQPPASDGFNRPPRSLCQPSGKRPGGQAGHKGQTLRFNANPDHIVLHAPQQMLQLRLFACRTASD